MLIKSKVYMIWCVNTCLSKGSCNKNILYVNFVHLHHVGYHSMTKPLSKCKMLSVWLWQHQQVCLCLSSHFTLSITSSISVTTTLPILWPPYKLYFIPIVSLLGFDQEILTTCISILACVNLSTPHHFNCFLDYN